MRRRTGRKREKFIGDSEQKRKRDAAKKRNKREKWQR
jgi:hypothetical protein